MLKDELRPLIDPNLIKTDQKYININTNWQDLKDQFEAVKEDLEGLYKDIEVMAEIATALENIDNLPKGASFLIDVEDATIKMRDDHADGIKTILAELEPGMGLIE